MMVMRILYAVSGITLCSAVGFGLFQLLRSNLQWLKSMREKNFREYSQGERILEAVLITSLCLGVAIALLFGGGLFGVGVVMCVLFVREPEVFMENSFFSSPVVPLAVIFMTLNEFRSNLWEKGMSTHWLTGISILASLFVGLTFIHFGTVGDWGGDRVMWIFIGILGGIGYFVGSQREMARKFKGK